MPTWQYRAGQLDDEIPNMTWPQDDFPEYELNGSPSSFGRSSMQHTPAEPSIQETHQDPHVPRVHDTAAQWRCLRCAASTWFWNDDHWVCLKCGSVEFYEVSQSTKKLTPEGTWLPADEGVDVV